MKYLITESQLDKAYSKYLDYVFHGIHMDPLKSDDTYKVYSTDEIRAFTYSTRSKDVYVFEMFVEEFKDMFNNLDSEGALDIVGKWIEYKFNYTVRDVIPVDIMST
jgi:hypothetical protein